MKKAVTFEVIGEGSVVVFDAYQAQIHILPNQSVSGFNLAMHILNVGDRFNIKTRKVMR